MAAAWAAGRAIRDGSRLSPTYSSRPSFTRNGAKASSPLLLGNGRSRLDGWSAQARTASRTLPRTAPDVGIAKQAGWFRRTSRAETGPTSRLERSPRRRPFSLTIAATTAGRRAFRAAATGSELTAARSASATNPASA